MIWDLRDCLAIRATLVAAANGYESYDNEVLAAIHRILGRPFPGAASGLEAMS